MNLPSTQIRSFAVSLTWLLLVCSWTVGCGLHHDLEPVANVRTLGSITDEINQRQEENAEAAKFTVYMHEFEINAPPIDVPETKPGLGELQSTPGYRLTPAGQDHVREIARQMLIRQDSFENGHPPSFRVVVERSNTSKLASTVYQYPVHYNAQLDAVRRQMVVSALQQLGVSWADSCVIVAPAFATGMNASASAAAYQKAMGVGMQSNGGSVSGSGGPR